jgi:hypothetical protein
MTLPTLEILNDFDSRLPVKRNRVRVFVIVPLLEHDGRHAFRTRHFSSKVRGWKRSHFSVGIGTVDKDDTAVRVPNATVWLDFLHAVPTGALKIDLLYIPLLTSLATMNAAHERRHFGRTVVRHGDDC